MRTVRLYVNQPLAAGQRLELSAERSRYLTQALRLAAGAMVHVFNESDGEFAGRIDTPRKRATVLAIDEPVAVTTESPLDLTLAQAVGRGDRMDYAVQKATELGVTHIQPLVTERTEVRLRGQRAINRRDRWYQIARAACEQSGRTCPPSVALPATVGDWLIGLEGTSTRLVLEPNGAATLKLTNDTPPPFLVAVGPEGGWTTTELGELDNAAFRAVRLGPRTLRTETAAAVAVALIQAQVGDLQQ